MPRHLAYARHTAGAGMDHRADHPQATSGVAHPHAGMHAEGIGDELRKPQQLNSGCIEWAEHAFKRAGRDADALCQGPALAGPQLCSSIAFLYGSFPTT